MNNSNSNKFNYFFIHVHVVINLSSFLSMRVVT